MMMPRSSFSARRRVRWLALPDEERWVTVLLDLDEVMCVGQPHSAGILHKSLQGGEELDQQLLDGLFSPAACSALIAVQEQLEVPVRYVISSSWREHFTRHQLEQIFRRAGLGFVAGNLYEGAAWRCYQSRVKPERDADIEDWLERFHHGEPFVIVDDTHSGGGLNFHRHFPHSKFAGRVILCQPGTGLTMGHVANIVAALRRPV